VLRQRKFFIGGSIVLLAIGFLGYSAFAAAATYYFTVSEVMAQGDSAYQENLRVNGNVVSGSVDQGSAGRVLKFTIFDVDGGDSLPVVYQGITPDTFKVDSEVVVEGHLTPDGTFQAHTLLTKCPSKYVPAE
jgi:cytochrome c-type biogenesis protein CcmE